MFAPRREEGWGQDNRIRPCPLPACTHGNKYLQGMHNPFHFSISMPFIFARILKRGQAWGLTVDRRQQAVHLPTVPIFLETFPRSSSIPIMIQNQDPLTHFPFCNRENGNVLSFCLVGSQYLEMTRLTCLPFLHLACGIPSIFPHSKSGVACLIILSLPCLSLSSQFPEEYLTFFPIWLRFALPPGSFAFSIVSLFPVYLFSVDLLTFSPFLLPSPGARPTGKTGNGTPCLPCSSLHLLPCLIFLVETGFPKTSNKIPRSVPGSLPSPPFLLPFSSFQEAWETVGELGCLPTIASPFSIFLSPTTTLLPERII